MRVVLLFLLVQGFEPAPPTSFDNVIEATLETSDPILAGHGPSKPVEYTAEFSGTLHIWTKAARDVDLFLRLEDEAATLLREDDNGGGGNTPYLALVVEPGRTLSIQVALAHGTGSAAFQLYTVAAPETPATRSAARVALEAVVEIKALRARNELVGARELAEHALDELLGVADAATSEAVAKSAWFFGYETHALSSLVPSRRAWALVLAHRSRTLPEDHASLQAARQTLAVAIRDLGDLPGARALEEPVLEVYSRTLPDDHPDLQLARQNLAVTIKRLGDFAAARALEEKVLEIRSRALSDDDPTLQAARQNLAATIAELGDLAGARALEEKVLEIRSRTLSDDDPKLQSARQNLAGTIKLLGDLAGARTLEDKVLDVRSRTLPEDHPDLQAARLNLAGTIKALGDLARARALEEQVFEVRSRTLPEDHPDLQHVRANLAVTIAELAASAGAALTREGLEADRRSLGELALAHAKTLRRSVVLAVSDASSREAEERVSSHGDDLGNSLSFAEGLGVFASDSRCEEAAFLASESMRGASLAWARVARSARGDVAYDALRSRARRAIEELARITQAGASAQEFTRVRSELETAQRELVQAALQISGGEASFLEPALATLVDQVKEGEALVAYRRYRRVTVGVDPPYEIPRQSLCAFVVRRVGSGARDRERDAAFGEPTGKRASEGELTRVELGPIEPIERAVERWRDTVGATRERGASASLDEASECLERGDEVRALVLDPLAHALDGVERLVVVLDDVLHAIPLDALPAGSSWNRASSASGEQHMPPEDALFGDVRRVDLRHSHFELVSTQLDESGDASLLALGHAAFDSEPVDLASDSAEARSLLDTAPRAAGESVLVRSSPWERGFATLPETRAEVRAIADYFEDVFGENSRKVLLERGKASRENLFALAPHVRFLHIATHGWFAPESVKSADDPTPIDKLSGLGLRTSGADHVRGMSPMLLCGLALAGANLPASATGRIPGLVTAEELSTLDLSNCDLAVLSACDTNVGVRRAGQGVASLQRALHMAGARSVITSLWKVPDEATKELMADFYRRLWVEKKPKHRALWEAKLGIRNAKDERGKPKYSTRDWAAWVLTGDPE